MFDSSRICGYCKDLSLDLFLNVFILKQTMYLPRVAYFYDPSIEQYTYGERHLMKVDRVSLTHDLVLSYGLDEKMLLYKPRKPEEALLAAFHVRDYLNALKHPETLDEEESKVFGFGIDCPPFDGVYDYSSIVAGGSIDGAILLNHGKCDIAINWSGGLHHAQRNRASGFCYINDIVLAILELLKYHHRVLYVDIDAHHGDGVERAFYANSRVMTLSFHRRGVDFFPGTGSISDLGCDEGMATALNFPLDVGVDDVCFEGIVRPILEAIMYSYSPGAVVLQSGTDSLAGDPIGGFNLSSDGHAIALRILKTFNVPLLLLGGGGYEPNQVARAWTNETAIAVGVDLNDRIPNEAIHVFGETLAVKPTEGCRNRNTREDVELKRSFLLEVIRRVPAPGAFRGRSTSPRRSYTL